jgi:decaprenylphospho-beta-D-erythro-pentofuranosid-2-ulose 2-reductase
VISRTNILILGANSDIARTMARRLATSGSSFTLIARNRERLNALASDLRVRGAVNTAVLEWDALRDDTGEVMSKAIEPLDHIDIAIIAQGLLPDQGECEGNRQPMMEQFTINALATIDALRVLGNAPEKLGKGSIVVLSSVAGDRGRASNYAYGSAKSAVSTFAEGLAGRLASSDVRVLLVKLGLVDTKMTADFRKGILWASPDDVAKRIIALVESGRMGTVYVPWFWRIVSAVIQRLPLRLLARLNL